MMDWITSLPLVPAIAFLWGVVLCRAGGTHLLGRGTIRLADRGRVADFAHSPRIERAVEIVNRWGAPVVALSFLTVGFQTAANFAAGLTRMPWHRYLPALVIGGLAWAIIYATVGLAAVVGWLELFLRNPVVACLLLVLVVALVVGLVLRRRRARARAGADGGIGDRTDADGVQEPAAEES